MTRRTEWAEHEYASPGAPRGRGIGGDSASARAGDDQGYGPGYGDEAYGGRGHSTGDHDHGEHGEYVAQGHGGHGDDGYGGRGDASYDRPGQDGPDPTGDRRGPAKRRGRRRRFGDPGGETEDSLSSSRAERGESSADPAERARNICLRLLTGTPRTRKQLADALRKREIPEEVADEVLSRFEEVGLINDSAFADAWVESRHHGRGLARRALARELRTKGVDSALIDEAVGQLDSEQEEATARDLVDRKLRATRGLDRDKRLRRLAGMLARKGYPEGMALRVVRQALEEEGEDTEFLEGEGY
ncbi:recombination regulator RecX [Streptomyces sp. DSM 110735]|uniref:recombination regulator RecX n=1 Tax=Streptomyces sp. DSM 110735 TaxID=2775031 RepID=UPI0018F6F770|nr:recombination regulator RecX [Streptomyces sp. DSM 110735]MBJ7903686.1 recombination regulator RecX [Streptomyces sp. DSM 110735]